VVWSGVVIATGGVTFQLGPVIVRSHRPVVPLAIGLALLAAVVAISGKRSLREDGAALSAGLAGLAPWWAAAMAVLALVVGVRFGTFVAGGADSYGYVSQAQLWAEGRLETRQALATGAPWPSADWTFAPLGYRPSLQRGAIVPTYPPGLPLLMGGAIVIGGRSSAFLVVPIAGAAFVGLTYLLGRRLDGPTTGAVAATLVASSPIVLYQLVQPMSDVPAATACAAMAVFAFRRGTWSIVFSGLAGSLLVLIRPNLFPVLVPTALFVGWTLREERRWHALRGMMLFLAAGAVGPVMVAAIQATLYGSPFRSGYGTLPEIYALAHVSSNVSNYAGWLLESQTPLVSLALFAPFLVGREARDEMWALLGIAMAVFACYLAYTVFDHWSYLRFLLPALPIVAVFTAVVMLRGIAALSIEWRGAAIALTSIGITLWYGAIAAERGAFDLSAAERRYVEAADYIRTNLPEQAVVLTVQHSGSVRYYSGRTTLRWDYLGAEGLDAALAWLRNQGRPPHVLLEDDEEAPFRSRFGPFSAAGRLEWPPIFTRRRPPVVRIYDLTRPESVLQLPPASSATQASMGGPTSGPASR
jgi:hypothetical protein